MATLLLRRSLLPTICASSLIATPLLFRPQELRCDTSASPQSPAYSYTRDVHAPILTPSRRPNPATFRQLSLGSMLGLFGGLAVSAFSKPLTMLIGLLICAVYGLESRGVKIVSDGRLASWLGRKVDQLSPGDARSAVLDNLAFKFAFGSAFALAAFGSLDGGK